MEGLQPNYNYKIYHYLKSPSLTIYKVITNVNLSKIMSTKKNNTNIRKNNNRKFRKILRLAGS